MIKSSAKRIKSKNAVRGTVVCLVRERTSGFSGTFLRIRFPSIGSLKSARAEGRKGGRKERAIPSAAGVLLRSNGVKQLEVTNRRQTGFVLKSHGFVEGQWFPKCCTSLASGQSVKWSALCRKINMTPVSPTSKISDSDNNLIRYHCA